jgi:hypothetical protein
VRAAMERGIPTICQKPFGAEPGAGRGDDGWPSSRRAAGGARELPLRALVPRKPPLIDSGFFGRVHGISFRLRPGDGQGPQAYLDRQPYFQQMPQFLVRETAVHFIDTFRFLLGEVRAVTRGCAG